MELQLKELRFEALFTDQVLKQGRGNNQSVPVANLGSCPIAEALIGPSLWPKNRLCRSFRVDC